ncbi:MAG: response regulator [Saprospiraceae bacterium]|nr:response regulator [Saprospiraceae bacterium]
MKTKPTYKELKSKVEELEYKYCKKSKESNKLKAAFLSNISHEIRTPMNAILGFSELLRDESIISEKKDEFLKYIKSNCSDLLKLIDDIIDISNIETKKIQIIKSECFINSTLSQLYINTKKKQHILGKDNIKLRLKSQISSPNFSIITDSKRFSQLFTKLLDNALKFTNSGSIEFGFKIKDSDNLLFYIKDTGVGMSDDKFKVIFDKFRQVENEDSKVYGGTGIGLTITKKLVNLLGGEIWVESELGIGSNFYFTLPFETIKTPIANKNLNKFDTLNYNWEDKVILVAEDEDMNHRLIYEILKRTNVKIIRAMNGVQAVELCKTSPDNKIDLILMDIKMPEMDGYEATKIIKEFNSEIPIIAQTAYALPGDFEKSIDVGCNDYITKPLRAQSLLSLINKYIKI